MATAAELEALAGLRIRESIAAHEQLAANGQVGVIVRAARLIADSYRNDGKLLLFGNGGSAADAQHIAAEFLGRFQRERQCLPAVALSDNNASLTAIANDYSFADVYARQVRGLGRRDDVVLAISTSGNSANVVAAVEAARDVGLTTIALVGEGGGELSPLVDVCIGFPARSTPRVQEGHALIGHLLCELVESELYPDA
jgi:D-sedoheptulose 7-phosphate isomerase